MNLAENFLPLRFDLVPVSGIDGMDLGKLIAPGKGPACVENRPRIGEIARRTLFRRELRIDGAAPAITRDLDTGLGIAARANRPHNFGHISRIYIIVHEHDEAAEITALARAQRDVRRLPGVTTVPLFKRN